jgi:putative component of membrane protein insertase Oxa1/YidC/SpoIIIJ protein YidD
MRLVALIIIRLYWLIPASKRPQCIFKESCSNHVYRIVKCEGFLAGLKAFFWRFKNCRPGYQYLEINKERFMLTANNELVPEDNIRQL